MGEAVQVDIKTVGMLHTAMPSCIGPKYDEAIVASAQAAWLYERESGYNSEEYEVWGFPVREFG